MTLHNAGMGYSALNSARSAISAIANIQGNTSIQTSSLVTRFMKGVFNVRPSLPRYDKTWDVKTVLEYLKSLGNPADRDLKLLTLSTATLLGLLTGQRVQTLHLLHVNNIIFTDNYVKIHIEELLKQTRPGVHLPELVLEQFSKDKSLCIVTYLSAYLEKTKTIRQNEEKLFISFTKPFKRVTKDTLSRWIKSVLLSAGIDTNFFKAHSIRSASASSAAKSVPIATIMKTAGWSSECVFRKFYQKSITCDSTYSNAILSLIDDQGSK